MFCCFHSLPLFVQRGSRRRKHFSMTQKQQEAERVSEKIELKSTIVMSVCFLLKVSFVDQQVTSLYGNGVSGLINFFTSLCLKLFYLRQSFESLQCFFRNLSGLDQIQLYVHLVQNNS